MPLYETYHQLRQTLKHVEKGQVPFTKIYQELDRLQKKPSEPESKDEDKIQEYVKIMETMLGSYKRQISKIREESELLWKVLKEEKTNNKLSQKSNSQLDKQIKKLTYKLKKHIK